MILNRGTQVVYVPSHIRMRDRLSYPFNYPNGAQPGFVLAGPTGTQPGAIFEHSYFIRYWMLENGHPINELRTKANSESTPTRLLIVENSVDQLWVDAWIAAYLSKGGAY